MKTDDLIAILARGAGPAPRRLPARRVAPVAMVGFLVSAALVLALHEPLPPEAIGEPALWIKVVYAGALALAAGWLTARRALPVARLVGPTTAVLAVVLLMAAFALGVWLQVPSGERLPMLFGLSWRSCPWSLLALSLPTLAGALWVVRGLAPTRLRQAGFAAGLLAGSVAALAYATACPESSAVFIAVWYSLGILLSGALGAFLGPRVLRW